MSIVIEGPDNSGKSTLARIIAKRLGLVVVESEGPPKFDGEINQRIERYSQLPSHCLFVRHPCVSQVIYSKIRDEESSGVDDDLIRMFYQERHLLIYCDPSDRGLSDHVIKDHDSKKHLKALKEGYNDLLSAYREWAIDRAQVCYRIGDDINRVVKLCSIVA